MATQKTGNNTDKMKRKAADAAGTVKPSDTDSQDHEPQANYGFAQNAEVNPDGQTTKRQEYKADGLPRTQQYSVDKVGRRHGIDDLSGGNHVDR